MHKVFLFFSNKISQKKKKINKIKKISQLMSQDSNLIIESLIRFKFLGLNYISSSNILKNELPHLCHEKIHE